MSKNIGYQTNYYMNNNDNNSNEKFLYNERVNNQNYSQNKDKEYPPFTPVSVNQQQAQTQQSQIQLLQSNSQPLLPPQQQNLLNINTMLNYEPDTIEENDNLKKPKLRKTYFKLPSTVSYRMKNKSYPPNNTNMNNDCNGNMNVFQLIFGNEYMDDSNTKNDKRLYFRKSILSDNFKVLSAREFPGMRESSPLVKLFAEQGLKIRIRKDKSLGKHPSKRIFVDLPGYDYFEKKKTTYIYVGKYPRYGFKETERNNSKNEIVFENETKKVINQNHDDYIKDPNFQNTPDNIYNKYMSKPDGYYGENDYNRDMRGPMDDNYRDISGNNMVESRNKMNMKNYLNNEEMGLNRYDNNNNNSNNYRMMPPGNRNGMNDQEMNKKGNMGYYEETQYSYYSETKMEMKGQCINKPPYPNDRRDEYKPNSYDKPSDFNGIMPPRPYPSPSMGHPYMNDFNNKKIYDERRNSYGYDDHKDGNKPPLHPPPPPSNMDRNDFYQRMPGGRNEKNEDYERYRHIKMEEGVRSLPNPMYDNNKPDGNPPYNYPEGPMNNEYSRKRKFNSLEDNYIVNNNNNNNNNGNQYYNDPRKGPIDDYDRMMAREKNNSDFGHKTFYSAKEEETKTYIRRIQYYDDKRGNEYPKESAEGFEGDNYYSTYKPRTENMHKNEGVEPRRPDNYNPMIQNKKPPYMNNDFAYRNNDNSYNDGRNGPPPPLNKNVIRYNDHKEDNPMNYRREYNDMPPNRPGQYDYNRNDYPNNPNGGGNNFNYYSSYEEKRFNSTQEINRYEPNRENNINPPNIPNKDPYYPGNNNDKYYDCDNKNYYNNGNQDMYSSSYLPLKNDGNEPLPRNENRNNEGSFKPIIGTDNYSYSSQKPNNNNKNNPNIYSQGPNYDQNNNNYPPYPNMTENDKRNLYAERKNELSRPDKSNINNYRPSNSTNKIEDIINDNSNNSNNNNNNNSSNNKNPSNNDYSNSQNNTRINIRNVINE
ncbi:hypothetical protein PIROE2DRAFT_68480 [Piromyces sp. E2]|nr:hypothetical protein PIROE2DRAFT_68480 [Piromyces sp. E2]|eukprot:OUM69904.1 hypothetical protein PIROE2DRAFT_68480 [Piromyces sp. E2]